MSVNIKEAVTKLRQEFSHLTNQEFDKAVTLAINYSLSRAKTAIGRNVRKEFNLSAGDYNEGTKLQRARPAFGKQSGALLGKTSPFNVSRFNARLVQNNVLTQFVGRRRGKNKGGFASRRVKGYNSNSLYVTIYSGREEEIPSAFLLYLHSGQAAVMARGINEEGIFSFMKPRLPIGGLTSKSVFTSIINPDVIKESTPAIAEIFTKRLLHELTEGVKHWK